MATGSNSSIIPKKSLGQHWLVNTKSLRHICDAAQLSKEDIVLEIGPGLGNLTELLLKQANKVIAIELDQELYTRLDQQNLEGLEVINQDILKFNFNDLPEGYKIVANIPYYLTGKLIRLISDAKNRPTRVVLLVQKEIAERMTAEPGQLSILGLMSQYFWELSKGDIIGADQFDPSPKVDSQVIIMEPRIDLALSGSKQAEFFSLIKVGFGSKRKTILNNLANLHDQDKESIKLVLSSARILPNRRPQSLSLEQWLDIYKILNQPLD